jgi:hypothetical protein
MPELPVYLKFNLLPFNNRPNILETFCHGNSHFNTTPILLFHLPAILTDRQLNREHGVSRW